MDQSGFGSFEVASRTRVAIALSKETSRRSLDCVSAPRHSSRSGSHPAPLAYPGAGALRRAQSASGPALLAEDRSTSTCSGCLRRCEVSHMQAIFFGVPRPRLQTAAARARSWRPTSSRPSAALKRAVSCSRWRSTARRALHEPFRWSSAASPLPRAGRSPGLSEPRALLGRGRKTALRVPGAAF